MQLRRHLTALILTVLTAGSLSLVATAQPASAATATKVASAYSNQPFIYGSPTRKGGLSYKDHLYVGAVMLDAAGNRVYEGTMTLQRKEAGKKSWKTISTSTTGSLYNSDMRAVGNATYRITYSGTGTYAPSSDSRSFKVQRKVDIQTISGRRAGFKGKVLPRTKTTITILKKQGRNYKKFRTQKTSKKGTFVIYLPAPRSGEFHWKIIYKGDKHFKSSTIKGYTY